MDFSHSQILSYMSNWTSFLTLDGVIVDILISKKRVTTQCSAFKV